MTPDIQATITRLKELCRSATPAPWSIELDPEFPVEVVHHTVNLKGEKDVLSVFVPAYGLEEFETPTGNEEDVNPDVRYAVAAVNAMPALIADHEATARKLAIYEKRLGYIAKHYPLAHLDALEHAPEQEN